MLAQGSESNVDLVSIILLLSIQVRVCKYRVNTVVTAELSHIRSITFMAVSSSNNFQSFLHQPSNFSSFILNFREFRNKERTIHGRK